MTALFDTIAKQAVLVAAAAFTAAACAQGPLFEHHAKLGCQACHAENPPSQKVKDGPCIKCHGDREKVGANSKSTPNPHLNHVDELYCGDCHHMHKPSELYCSQCHSEFKLKVP